jgi:hypothetical protein
MIPRVLSQVTMPGTNDGGVPGTPTSRAYGNPGTINQNNIPSQGWPYKGTREGRPGDDSYSAGDSGAVNQVKQPANQYGGDPQQGHPVHPGVMNPPHTPWRGGANFGLDNTIARDRHIMSRNMEPRTGTQRSVAGNPPNPDSADQGPPRPVNAMLNRSVNPQQGSDNNANQDDLTRAYTRDPNGRFIGEQGSGWSPVYGGVPGLVVPYGSYSGYTAREFGKGDCITAPVAQGAPGDGPRKVWSGPPHGLHSQTQPDYSTTIGRYMAIPQQHAPRIDRPANSNIAGQDYSQTVQPQGQTGTVAQSPVVGKQRFTSASRFSETGGISGN